MRTHSSPIKKCVSECSSAEMWRILKIFVLLGFISNTQIVSAGTEYNKFPDDFQFGVASAAYQIEGAWDVDGKGENSWDRFSHANPKVTMDGKNGDIACDAYNKIEEDIALLKDLGVDYYRFSLSWARIIPNPTFSPDINEKGIEHYNKLIDLLLENGIKPIVTLFHWDLPQSLENFGGFTNSIVIQQFAKYSRIAFERFGDRVKMWTTFNEPKVYCFYGYGGATLAPGKNLKGVAEYLCAHNLLRAHAEAYHIYNDTFKASQNGRVSITIDGQWYQPHTTKDQKAAETARQFQIGWFGHPIFSKTGDYPEVMRNKIERRSKRQGFTSSRLPSFTNTEIERLKGTADFISLNHYSTHLVASKNCIFYDFLSFEEDMEVDIFQNASWPGSASCVKKIVPWGLPKILKWIKQNYGDLDIYITENGVSDFEGLDDFDRIHYIYLYLNSVLKSIHSDQIKVKGYTYWSFLDDFEWVFGYLLKFGLYHVDFNDPNRPRIPKSSVEYYKQIIKKKKLNKLLPCVPDTKNVLNYFRNYDKYENCLTPPKINKDL